ncbi:beta-1,6-N-acetylglucosaminyltransferase [uncultured Roseobacter sp.]|uniref:DUF5927 domain-containing protein n=1 Tax=uncultured Roseobacter sp. TaxID=114847 RepID=UPI002630C4BC|nr:beta-1,6-N-acetylglucosaminyltransferase [uncultured Roseobacter sp.]
MSFGVILLVHADFDRAAQLVRHWARGGCPVVIHVDRRVKPARFDAFAKAVADLPDVLLSSRTACEWGTWGLVAATQRAAELMLLRFPGVGHVYLASGSCLPLRPVRELVDYLAARPDTDFIESATTSDVAWPVGGLDTERFTLRFPFPWKRYRRLFNGYVRWQRRLGVSRRVPGGLVPHMGSQWWCLTRATLSGILTDPARARYDRYFRRVWIPDESYFQTLARQHARVIESRSLTLSKFDFQGKPHVFYDDHLQLLRRSDCFVARKIWPRADKLYAAFLKDPDSFAPRAEPSPGRIDRVFSKAVDRRIRGRRGLLMQSRFPDGRRSDPMTAQPFSVFQGFAELFDGFEPWLARTTDARVHGHLFARDRVQFNDDQGTMAGGLSDGAALRDYDPEGFLMSLIWNTRGEHQCFQFSPDDAQAIAPRLARDPNAQISVISGAWTVPLFLSRAQIPVIRKKVAHLQRVETAYLGLLRAPGVKARARIWTLAEFVEAPMEHLHTILSEMGGGRVPPPMEVPRMVDLTGFDRFLQDLKNQGLHPHVVGDFPTTGSSGWPSGDTSAEESPGSVAHS